jgi:MinD superfamily P-loop ATPase
MRMVVTGIKGGVGKSAIAYSLLKKYQMKNRY